MHQIQKSFRGAGYGLALAALCTVGTTASADTLYDSLGFEGPTFTPGNLVGQDGWTQFTAASTATVSNSIPVAGGTQAVELFRGGGDGGSPSDFWVDVSTQPAHERFVFVEMDMWVEDSGDQDPDPNFESYGPGFGLDIYIPGNVRIAEFRVDSADGALVVRQPGGSTAIINSVATLGQYQQWRMILDFVDEVFYVELEGNVVTTSPFLQNIDYAGGDRLSDAALYMAATDEFYFNVEGTAYVDNYKITDSSVIPEPGSLALLGLGGLAMIRRRRA